MPNPNPSSPVDPQVLTLFQEELARAAAMPGLAPAGPELWPRFAGYYQGLARLPRRLRRALQRRWRRSLGGIALLCALGQAPAFAATINVGGGCTLSMPSPPRTTTRPQAVVRRGAAGTRSSYRRFLASPR